MTKELLSQPNVITRILALSSRHEAADPELYSLLSKWWFLVKGLGLLAEVWPWQVNLSPHKTFAEVQAEVRIQFKSFRLKSLLQTKESTQQTGVGCLFKVGTSCPAQHIWHRLLVQNTWPRNKFCSHTSARLTELQAPPQPLQLPKLQTNAFWHPKCVYSPLQSPSGAALLPNPPQSHEQIYWTKKIIYSPETKLFSPTFQQVSRVRAWKAMPQQFRAASPRTAAKKAFHWCFLPSCQRVLSAPLPRQQKSGIRTSHSAPDTSSYKQTGFHRRHCLKTILIWMGQDSGVWKTILARRMSSISSCTWQAAEPAVCSAISEAQQPPCLPDYLSQRLLFVIISTQCSPPKALHLRADPSWTEYRGALIHITTIPGVHSVLWSWRNGFQKERKIFSNSKKRWTVSRNSAPCMRTV